MQTAATGIGLSGRIVAWLFLLTLAAGAATMSVKQFIPLKYVILLVASLGAVTVMLVTLGYPKHGVYFAVFFIYSGLTHYLPVNVAYPVVLLASAAAILQIARGDEIQLRTESFLWTLAFFVLLSIQSLFFAWSITRSFYILGIFAKALVMVFLVVQFVRTPKDLERYAIIVFVASVCSVFFYMIALRLGVIEGDKVLARLGFIRFTGPRGDPNASAVYLVSTLPLAVFAFRRAWTVWLRVAVSVGAAVILLAVFLTLSRAAVFPLGVVLVMLLARDFRSRWVYLGLAIAVTLTILITPPIYWYRLNTLSQIFEGSSEDWSIYLRYKALLVSWQMFLDHPLTGVGIGNFKMASAPYLFARMVVHNAFMEILVGVGLFGLIAYLAMFGSAFSQLVHTMRIRWRGELAWLADLSYYLICSLAATMCGALFLSIPFNYVLWLPVAGALVAGRVARRYASENVGN